MAGRVHRLAVPEDDRPAPAVGEPRTRIRPSQAKAAPPAISATEARLIPPAPPEPRAVPRLPLAVTAPAPAPVAPDAPRLLTPDAGPSRKAYRVPAPPPKPVMTYAEAMVIRERHRNRQPVMAADLMEANRVVQETRHRALPPSESYGAT